MKACPTCGTMIDHVAPTHSQRRVLDHVIAYRERQGAYPPIAQIRQGLGYRTMAAVRYHLHQLSEDGWVTIHRGKGGLLITSAKAPA